MSLKILLGKFMACFAGQVPIEGHKNIIDSFQKLIVSPKRFICTHGEHLFFRCAHGWEKNKPRRGFPTKAFVVMRLFAVLEHAEFSQIGRVAYLRDEPRFRADSGCHLF